MGITEYNNLIKERDNMVNKEKQEVDGFGLPSTDVRKKDNALIEAARYADKVAKWYAEFPIDISTDIVDKEVEIVEIEEPKGPSKEELEAEAKAIKKAKLQAELDALQ